MLRSTLVALLALPLASAALGQESAITGSARPDVVVGRTGGKLAFTASGQATDLVVIRMADGTIIAEATIAALIGQPEIVRGSSAKSLAMPVELTAEKPFNAGLVIDTKQPIRPKPVLIKPIATLDATMKSASALEGGDSGKVDLGAAIMEGASKPLNDFTAVQGGANAVAMKEVAAGKPTLDVAVLEGSKRPTVLQAWPTVSGNTAMKALANKAPEQFAAYVVIQNAPAKLHGATVAIYREKAILDLDRINLR